MTATHGTLFVPHRPIRPGWECWWCGLDWPCAPGRLWLIRAKGRGPELQQLMHDLAEQAAEDMPDATPELIGPRFLAWTGPSEPLPPRPGR